MWNLNEPTLVQIAIRTAIVYAVLLLLVRISGKRQLGQLTPFDLVVLLLLSNSVQNAMTGPDTSVTGGIVAASVLILANALVSLIRLKSPGFQRVVEGVPVVLVSNGQVHFLNLRHEGMTIEELMANLREHEVDEVDRVELAMLEIDGSISVIRKTGEEGQYRKSRKKLVHHHRHG